MLAVTNSWSFAVNSVHDSKTPKLKNGRDAVAPPGPAWMLAEKIPEVFAEQKLPAGEWHGCHSPAAQGIEAEQKTFGFLFFEVYVRESVHGHKLHSRGQRVFC
jgi:hypothetical protein